MNSAKLRTASELIASDMSFYDRRDSGFAPWLEARIEARQLTIIQRKDRQQLCANIADIGLRLWHHDSKNNQRGLATEREVAEYAFKYLEEMWDAYQVLSKDKSGITLTF